MKDQGQTPSSVISRKTVSESKRQNLSSVYIADPSLLKREENGTGKHFLFKLEQSEDKKLNLSAIKQYRMKLNQIDCLMSSIETDQQKSINKIEREAEKTNEQVDEDILMREIMQLHQLKKKESLQIADLQKQLSSTPKASNNKSSLNSIRHTSQPPMQSSLKLSVQLDADTLKIPKFQSILKDQRASMDFSQDMSNTNKRLAQASNSIKLPLIISRHSDQNNSLYSNMPKLSQSNKSTALSPKYELTPMNSRLGTLGFASTNFSLPMSPLNNSSINKTITIFDSQQDTMKQDNILNQFQNRFKVKDVNKDYILQMNLYACGATPKQRNSQLSSNQGSSPMKFSEQEGAKQALGNQSFQDYNQNYKMNSSPFKKSKFSPPAPQNRSSTISPTAIPQEDTDVEQTPQNKMSSFKADTTQESFDIPLELIREDTLVQPNFYKRLNDMRIEQKNEQLKIGEDNQDYQEYKKKWQQELFLVLQEYKHTFFDKKSSMAVSNNKDARRGSSKFENIQSSNKILKLLETIEKQHFFKSIPKFSPKAASSINTNPTNIFQTNASSIFSKKRHSTDDQKKDSTPRKRINQYGKWFIDPDQFNRKFVKESQIETEEQHYQKIISRIHQVKVQARTERANIEKSRRCSMVINKDQKDQNHDAIDIEDEILQSLQQIAISLT